MPDPFGTCDRCGEALGAYEPLVLVLSDGTVVHGGLLSLHDRAGDGARLRHARCVGEADRSVTQLGAA